MDANDLPIYRIKLDNSDLSLLVNAVDMGDIDEHVYAAAIVGAELLRISSKQYFISKNIQQSKLYIEVKTLAGRIVIMHGLVGVELKDLEQINEELITFAHSWIQFANHELMVDTSILTTSRLTSNMFTLIKAAKINADITLHSSRHHGMVNDVIAGLRYNRYDLMQLRSRFLASYFNINRRVIVEYSASAVDSITYSNQIFGNRSPHVHVMN